MHSCRPQGHFRHGSNHYSSPESFDDDPPAISFNERRHRTLRWATVNRNAKTRTHRDQRSLLFNDLEAGAEKSVV